MKDLIKKANDLIEKCEETKKTYSFPRPFEFDEIIDELRNAMYEIKDVNSIEYEALFKLEDLLCDYYTESFQY